MKEWGDTIHAHHVRLGSQAGMGQKPSDYRCVPLCAYEHDLLHKTGEKEYWESSDEHPEVLIAGLLVQYLTEVLEVPGRWASERLEELIEINQEVTE